MTPGSNWRSEAPSPASHSHRSEPRNSSNIASALMTVGFMRQTVSCGCASSHLGGLPSCDQGVERGGVGARLDLLAQAGIAEQLRDLRKYFKMFLSGRFGHQQEDQQHHRLLVRRVESDRIRELEHRGHWRLEALDAPVRDGHAVAETGGTQALAGEQAVGDEGTAQAVQVFK